jgi:DNA-binding NarL/FixJ family response regulator
MRILLVDDDRPLLLLLSRGLHRQRPEWELQLAASGKEAVLQLRDAHFDVLVTDISMPEMDGLALLAAVREDPRRASIQIIFATSKDDRESMRTGMTAGADDYLTKPFTAEELVAAVESRLKRRPPSEAAAGDVAGLKDDLCRQLTGRELEILAGIGRGLGSKEIAAQLDISPRTVDVHRTNIMRKLDLHNAASLAGIAVKAGFA